MMKQGKKLSGQIVEDWSLCFPPASITIHNTKTGAQIQEPSLVAANMRSVEQQAEDPYTGETETIAYTVLDRYIAAGRAALAYQNRQDVAVFSPLRRGQVAHFDAARYLLTSLIKQFVPMPPLMKPVLCIHLQKQTTQVEERAMMDTGFMAGARKVLVYKHPLTTLLNNVHRLKYLQNVLIVHIEPQD